MTPGHRLPDPSSRDALIGLDDAYIDAMARLYCYERWQMTFEQYLRIALRFSAMGLPE